MNRDRDASIATRATTYIERAIEKHQIPALSAAISVDGEIVWAGAAGFAHVEDRVPATTATPFRIASISKLLTAVAVFRLAEAGTLDLDAPVRRYLPDYPTSKRGTITVRHLLTHTSGIRHSRGEESRLSLEQYVTLEEATRFFRDRPLASVPGKKYRYSSYGYTVLGAVVEAATGQSFETVMREQVWSPAGMSSTGLDRRPGEDTAAAGLYRLRRGEVIADVKNDLSLIYPGGGMVSTATDLLRFTQTLDAGELLSPSSLDQLRGDAGPPAGDGPPGIGWNAWSAEAPGRILSRVGGQSGASSLLVSYRDRGVTVALLANLSRLDPIWDLVNHLIGFGLEHQAASAQAPE